jgi:hypothetical protein
VAYDESVAELIRELNGWEAYCQTCGAFREPRRADEHDRGTGSEYFDFEFVCNTASIKASSISW